MRFEYLRDFDFERLKVEGLRARTRFFDSFDHSSRYLISVKIEHVIL